VSAEVSPDGMHEVTHPQPDVVAQTHGPAACAGQPCCIHNPSDHPMRDWPLVHRIDEPMYTIEFNTWGTAMHAVVVSERVCEHGQGHPDLDSVGYVQHRFGMIASLTAIYHLCDGCCPWKHGTFSLAPVGNDGE